MWICDKDEHCIDCPKNYPNEECEHYIEVQEVKHGRWLAYEFGNEHWHKCSVCGKADEYINNLGLVAVRNYCPNCGAKMEAE